MDTTLDESGIFALPSLDDAPCHSTPIKGSKVPLPSTRSIFKFKYRTSSVFQDGSNSTVSQMEADEVPNKSEKHETKAISDHEHNRKKVCDYETSERNLEDTGNMRRRITINEANETVTRIEGCNMYEKQATSFGELESGTLQKQRQEIQLLVSELKDRDRELSEMTASQQKQLEAWNQDKTRLESLDYKCSRLQEEIQTKTAQLKKAISNVKILKSREATLVEDLEESKATGEQLRAENSRLKDEEQQRKTQIQYLESHIEQLSSSVGRLNAREEELTTSIKLKERDIVSAMAQLHEATERLRQLDLRCKECQDREKEALKEKEDWKNRYENIAADLHKQTARVEKSQREIERLTQQNISARKQLALVQKEAAMHEQCKNDLLESMKVKQERTDAHLKNFREMYEHQLREVSELQKKLASSQDRASSLQTSLNEQGLDMSINLSHGRLSCGLESSPEKSVTCQQLNLSPRDATSPAPLLMPSKYSGRPDSDAASSGYQSQQLLETFASQSKLENHTTQPKVETFVSQSRFTEPPKYHQGSSIQSHSSIDSTSGSQPMTSVHHRQSTYKTRTNLSDTMETSHQSASSSNSTRMSRHSTKSYSEKGLARQSFGRSTPPPTDTSSSRNGEISSIRKEQSIRFSNDRETSPSHTYSGRISSDPSYTVKNSANSNQVSSPRDVNTVRSVTPSRSSLEGNSAKFHKGSSLSDQSTERSSSPLRSTLERNSVNSRKSCSPVPFSARQTNLRDESQSERSNFNSASQGKGQYVSKKRTSVVRSNSPLRDSVDRSSSPCRTSVVRCFSPTGASSGRSLSPSSRTMSPKRQNGYIVESHIHLKKSTTKESSEFHDNKQSESEISMEVRKNIKHNDNVSHTPKHVTIRVTKTVQDSRSSSPVRHTTPHAQLLTMAKAEETSPPTNDRVKQLGAGSQSTVRDEDYEKQFEFSQKVCSFLEDVGDIDDSIWDEKGHVSFQQPPSVEASPFTKLQRLLLESREMIEHLEQSATSQIQSRDRKNQSEDFSNNADKPS